MQTRRMIAQGSQSSVSRRWKKWISMLLPTGGNMMTLMYRAGGGDKIRCTSMYDIRSISYGYSNTSVR